MFLLRMHADRAEYELVRCADLRREALQVLALEYERLLHTGRDAEFAPGLPVAAVEQAWNEAAAQWDASGGAEPRDALVACRRHGRYDLRAQAPPPRPKRGALRGAQVARHGSVVVYVPLELPGHAQDDGAPRTLARLRQELLGAAPSAAELARLERARRVQPINGGRLLVDLPRASQRSCDAGGSGWRRVCAECGDVCDADGECMSCGDDGPLEYW